MEELDRLKASQDELNAGLASRATNERWVPPWASVASATPTLSSRLRCSLSAAMTIISPTPPFFSSDSVDQVEASLTDSWPPLETFADTPSGWKDQTGADFTATLACGAYGNVLGGFENYNRDLRLAKTYTVGMPCALPARSGFLARVSAQVSRSSFFLPLPLLPAASAQRRAD